MNNLIAGLVLAGGQSRRMGGGDKFQLDLHGQTLLERAIARLKPQVGDLAISANCDPALLGAYGLPVLPDAPPSGRGPLAGTLAGLDWAADNTGARYLVNVASDTPFFPADLVARLLQAVGNDLERIALASSNGRTHPVFGLWPVTLRRPLREWLGNERSLKVTDFVESHQWTVCDFAFDSDADPFFNINTPDDLTAAARRAAEKMP
jgi:molybdenum cofactor guanylyltransferase